MVAPVGRTTTVLTSTPAGWQMAHTIDAELVADEFFAVGRAANGRPEVGGDAGLGRRG